MKKYIKTIFLSVAVVLVLNILILTILTLYQAPYYSKAPQKVDSIYELYASDEYNDILYAFSTGFIRGGDKKIQNIEDMFKTTSVTKLDWLKSYCKLITLKQSDFVVYSRTTIADDREIVKNEIMASNICVFVENNIVYVICLEFTEYEYQNEYQKVAVYQVENEKLARLLEEYKTPSNKGFQIVLPEWRDDLSDFPRNFQGVLYVLSIIIEFIVSLIVINKFFVKKSSVDNNNTKTKKQLSDMQKRCIIAVLFVLVIVLIIVLIVTIKSSLHSSSPSVSSSTSDVSTFSPISSLNPVDIEHKKAIDTYLLTVNYKADEKTLKSFAPEQVWNFLETEKNISFDFVYNKYSEKKEMIGDLEYYYNDVTCEVLGEEKLDKNALKELSKCLNIYLGLPENICNEAYELKVKMTDNVPSPDPYEWYVTIFKIGDEWYCVNQLIDFLDFCYYQYEENSFFAENTPENGTLIDSYFYNDVYYYFFSVPGETGDETVVVSDNQANFVSSYHYDG